LELSTHLIARDRAIRRALAYKGYYRCGDPNWCHPLLRRRMLRL